MDIKEFYGVFTPVISPCDDRDNFLETVFAENTGRLFKAGVNGLYVCGGTGDTFNMRVQERKLAAEIAVESAKKQDKKIIVHVGGTHLRDSQELAEHAAEIGAMAVSSIPPADLSRKQVVEYYTRISKASGLPVLVYHIPAVTHRNPSFEELVQLLDVDGVVGLKMTDWNLFLMRRLVLERPGIVVYNGYDELVCLGLQYGAHGSIGTWQNLLPEMYVSIYGNFVNGRLEKALDIQKSFVDFLNIGWKYGIIEVFELLMRELGYAQRCFRRPYSEMAPQTAKDLLPILLDRLEAIRSAVKGG